MEKLITGAEKLGLQLDPRQLKRFSTYYHELMEWNQRINLTKINGYENVQIKHFLDSLTLTLAWQPHNASLRLIDVGTGAGIPGLPLKILFPEIRLVLLEATEKKIAFLHYIKDKLELDNIEIVVGRAEEVAHLHQYREQFDLVLSRGVAQLPTLVEFTLPFAIIGGIFIAQKKGPIEPEISQAANAISLLGGKLREVKEISLEEFAEQRYLVIIDKVSPTPPKYPRRSGIPRKRPLI